MKMKQHVIVILSLFFFASVFAAPALGEPPKDPDKFKFGFISCITGPAAWIHDLWAPAGEIAVEEINAAGGIFGKPMELIWEDHKSGDPKAAVSSMYKLADMDKVPFVIVTFTPPNMAAQPISAEKKIMQVNIGAWGPQLIGKPYLFNSRLVANVLAEGGAKVAWNKGYRRAAILHPNDTSGVTVKNYMVPLWKKWGGKIVATETTDLGASDFHVQLAKIRVSKPDVILNYFYSMDLGYSLKQAAELGMKQEHYGLLWNKKLFKAAGPACKAFYFVQDYFNADSDKPWTKKFVEAYKKRTKGTKPAMYAANSYELTYILKELIEEARKKGGNYYTGDNLIEALLKIRSFETIYEDKISFRDDGSCVKSMALYHAAEKDGAVELVKKLSLD
jgi:branched-chain amino acid transport system substrate-binding protein